MSALAHDDGDRGFDAPWQARAFAVMEALVDEGHLDRAEWRERLAAEIAGGDGYWECFVRALERVNVVATSGAASSAPAPARPR